MASHEGHHQAVKSLIGGLAEISLEGSKISPLIMASQNGHQRVVDLLIEARAEGALPVSRKKLLSLCKGHQIRRSILFTAERSATQAFVLEHLSSQDSAWKFCFQFVKPLKFSFAPESVVVGRRVCTQFLWHWVQARIIFISNSMLSSGLCVLSYVRKTHRLLKIGSGMWVAAEIPMRSSWWWQPWIVRAKDLQRIYCSQNYWIALQPKRGCGSLKSYRRSLSCRIRPQSWRLDELRSMALINTHFTFNL